MRTIPIFPSSMGGKQVKPKGSSKTTSENTTSKGVKSGILTVLGLLPTILKYSVLLLALLLIATGVMDPTLMERLVLLSQEFTATA